MLRRAYIKQLTDYLNSFNAEELKDYISCIEPYFMNEKYSEEELLMYVQLLSISREVIDDWLFKTRERRDIFFEHDTYNAKMFKNFLHSIKDELKDKKVFFLTSYDSSVTVEAAKLGAKVLVYDRHHHAFAGCVLESIKNDVSIRTMTFMNMMAHNPCDIIIAYQALSHTLHPCEAHWNYLKLMQEREKTIYIVSPWVFEGTHPIIKLDKKPNIVYSENLNGIERAVFNGI